MPCVFDPFTCPSILAVVVQVVQVFQIFRVDDGRTGRSVPRTPDRSGTGTSWDSSETVFSPYFAAINTIG